MINRPDPDALLRRVEAEEPQAAKGRLKVFFGMAPGVGKTYAMLAEAGDLKQAGVDVAAGVIETHGRQDTERLLEGIELLPPRQQAQGSVTLREFDLDAALARHPKVLLVDELAHTNVPGSRHAKRWQDVEELLDAGIDIFTTINVQHLESLNDVVAQITGVQVRETVPDHLLERADDIELIDLTPGELQTRLREGKVYVPHSAERALKNFFREGNLTALRELALRRTAQCVDAQMQKYRRDHEVPGIWPTAERILVCIGPHPLSARLVRTARRMAVGMHAEWLVAWVETSAGLPDDAMQHIEDTLRLAESLGAQTVHLSGDNVAEVLLEFARERNVAKIVVGKPAKTRWNERLFGSIVDDVVHASGGIDVHVISGEAPPAHKTARAAATFTPLPYIGALGIVGFCTLLAWLMHKTLSPPNMTMIYLAGVVITAAWLGRGPSVLAAFCSMGAFDYFFVPPFYTFSFSDVEYTFTFAGLLGTGLLISHLTARVRAAAEAARNREKRTLALYSLTRDLAVARSVDSITDVALRHIEEMHHAPAVMWLPDGENLTAKTRPAAGWVHTHKEQGVARWVFDHATVAGAGTNTLPAAQAIYLPLRGAQNVEGVLGVQIRAEQDANARLAPLPAERLHDLETVASQVALALERARLANETQNARLQIETERLRNSLLSAVSHDLRTPLASIVGASSSLMDDAVSLPESTRRELLLSIANESERLHRLVSNLLEMSRLQSGAVRIHKEEQPLEEVVGAAMARFEDQFGTRKVTTNLPPDLPMVPIDATLMEQVFINLIENALKYSPPTGSLHVAALKGEDSILVEVSDRGPGIPAGEEKKIFDPFSRATSANGEHADQRSNGAGLGLAICRAIVEAHGGAIWVENRPRGGAVFRFTLPLKKS
jgi:two-component system sensor histidine kinase KdpD